MPKRSKWIYLIISIILTLILQTCCFKHIIADKWLVIISSLLYIICFLVICESIYLILKKVNVMENIKMFFIAIIGISFMLVICIFR